MCVWMTDWAPPFLLSAPQRFGMCPPLFRPDCVPTRKRTYLGPTRLQIRAPDPPSPQSRSHPANAQGTDMAAAFLRHHGHVDRTAGDLPVAHRVLHGRPGGASASLRRTCMSGAEQTRSTRSARPCAQLRHAKNAHKYTPHLGLFVTPSSRLAVAIWIGVVGSRHAGGRWGSFC